jgi:L-lactate dehydrogenase complex protein LldF
MYLGMCVAGVLFSRAWLFHAAQRLGRFGLGFFTGSDGWIHSLPGMGGKWTQTRDLRGLPNQTFHDWWSTRKKEAR